MTIKCKKCHFKKVKKVTQRDPDDNDLVIAVWNECGNCKNITDYTKVNKISTPPEA